MLIPHFLRVESSVELSDAAVCRTLVACSLNGCKLPLMNEGPEHRPWPSTLHISPPQQPRGQGFSCSHFQSSEGGQETASWHAQQGFKLSASLSGGSEHWARDAWEPLRHRVSMMWVVLVGNAREERFPSEFTRLGHSVLVKSSGKSALVLSCRPHSESSGSLLPVGTW